MNITAVMYSIALASFLLWMLRNTLFWVSLWQRKEYRLDRLLAELRETSAGHQILFSPFLLGKLLLLFIFPVIFFKPQYLLLYQIVATLFLAIEAVQVLGEIYTRTLRHPVFTIKALLFVSVTVYIFCTVVMIPLVDKFAWFIFLDRILPFFISFLVFAFSLPTILYRDYKIERATKKILAHKNLTVIGVTGSYGKSSTKEYIAQVLSKNFSVLKTRESHNTPIGVASTILSGLKDTTEVFVVEMGAYKRGEIMNLCAIARPKIGVLTAVAGQHLSLFGSLKNIEQAKYELIESLPRNGLGIFNGNNDIVYRLYKDTTKKKALYITDSGIVPDAKLKHADIVAKKIIMHKEATEFDAVIKGKTYHMKTPLIGMHVVQNILPAIYIASHMEIPVKDIIHAVSALSPLPHTMVVSQISTGAATVDNTFNVNPDAIRALLEYLKMYKGKKIIVLEPMIELGKKAKEEHYTIAKEIGKVCDYLFLTKKNFSREVTAGIQAAHTSCKVKIGSPRDISLFVVGNTEKGDVIALVGKESRVVLSKIRKG